MTRLSESTTLLEARLRMVGMGVTSIKIDTLSSFVPAWQVTATLNDRHRTQVCVAGDTIAEALIELHAELERMAPPVCATCDDTHRMWAQRAESMMSCTRCPLPCRACAINEGRGAFCAITPCSCECHSKTA